MTGHDSFDVPVPGGPLRVGRWAAAYTERILLSRRGATAVSAALMPR